MYGPNVDRKELDRFWKECVVADPQIDETSKAAWTCGLGVQRNERVFAAWLALYHKGVAAPRPSQVLDETIKDLRLRARRRSCND